MTRLIVGVLLVALLAGVLAVDQVLVRHLARRGLYRRDPEGPGSGGLDAISTPTDPCDDMR